MVISEVPAPPFIDDSINQIWTELVESMFWGILPAPKWVDRSSAEQLASKYVAGMIPRGARTQAEADRGKLRSSLLRDFQQQKEGTREKLQAAIRDGRLHESDATAITRDMKLTYLQRLVERIGLVDALNVWDKASDAEKNEIRQTVLKKAPLVRNMPPEMQAQLTQRIQQILNSRPGRSLPPAPVRQGATP